MHELETLTAPELARVLGKSKHSVMADVHRAPSTLPPRIKIPGSHRLLWLKKDVLAWLESHRAGPDPAFAPAPAPAPAKRGRGRPRKALPAQVLELDRTIDFVDQGV